MKNWITFCVTVCLIGGCAGKRAGSAPDSEMEIVRFDSALYRYLTENESENSLSDYRPFLDFYGEKVIGVGRSDSAGFYGRLRTYFANPALRQLYADQQRLFQDFDPIRRELTAAMQILLENFPQLVCPELYIHVSGWGQNVVASDRFLSLSADKYLGKDYFPYLSYFYDYQRQNMTPERVVPDFLLGFLMSNLPFRGNPEILLDRMIYEGLLRYFLYRALPGRLPCESVGYTPEQYAYCEKEQARLWTAILERRQLFTPDYAQTEAFLRDSPFTSGFPDAPGRIGIWLGFQIVKSYVKRYPEEVWTDLANCTDYSAFLRKSGFNPVVDSAIRSEW